MNDDQILELIRLSRSYIGQKRIWVAYAGDRTVVTCFNCGVNVSHTLDATKASIGSVWTNYKDRFGQSERVWFTEQRWESMEFAVEATQP